MPGSFLADGFSAVPRAGPAAQRQGENTGHIGISEQRPEKSEKHLMKNCDS